MRRPTNSIAFAHPAISAQQHTNELLSAFGRVLKSGAFVHGNENIRLTDALETYFKHGHIITTASGHDALYLALSALRLKPSDEVIFPVNSYPTAFPVALSHVTPVPTDVDENGQLQIQDVKRKITPRTKAVIIVHMYGLVGDLGGLKTLCKTNGITLIEDCAQAFGGRWQGQLLGTIGDFGCFSFYPTKNLGSIGEGGAIWTNNKKAATWLKKSTYYGESVRYHSEFLSGHSQIPELQAAGLNVYLRHIDKDFVRRKQVNLWYRAAFTQQKLDRYVRVLSSHPRSDIVPHLFVIRALFRDALRAYLTANHIQTLIHYPKPIHLVPSFRYLGYHKGDFPIAERLSTGIVSLPFHQYLTHQQVSSIVKTIADFYAASH